MAVTLGRASCAQAVQVLPRHVTTVAVSRFVLAIRGPGRIAWRAVDRDCVHAEWRRWRTGTTFHRSATATRVDAYLGGAAGFGSTLDGASVRNVRPAASVGTRVDGTRSCVLHTARTGAAADTDGGITALLNAEVLSEAIRGTPTGTSVAAIASATGCPTATGAACAASSARRARARGAASDEEAQRQCAKCSGNGHDSRLGARLVPDTNLHVLRLHHSHLAHAVPFADEDPRNKLG